jgi:hypothetical protein
MHSVKSLTNIWQLIVSTESNQQLQHTLLQCLCCTWKTNDLLGNKYWSKQFYWIHILLQTYHNRTWYYITISHLNDIGHIIDTCNSGRRYMYTSLHHTSLSLFVHITHAHQTLQYIGLLHQSHEMSLSIHIWILCSFAAYLLGRKMQSAITTLHWTEWITVIW